MKTVLTLILILIFSNIILSQIIPETRKISWNPGLVNGIPNVNNPIKNIMNFGADSTGNNDSKDAFVLAINSLPDSGGVVYIPKGKYKITSSIVVNKNNIVFRGDGISSTKLFMDFIGDCFNIVTYKRGDWQSVSSITKGSQTITVPDGTKFKIGQFAEIQQENNPELMYTKADWNVSWADNSVGQLLEIENIEENIITFKSKIHLDFSLSFHPQIRPQNFVKNVGFENFYIEKLVSGGNIFAFKNVAYCWIKNIESNHTRKSHVDFNTALGCEIRDSYFHHSFSYGGGGSGYGVRCGFHTTDVLIENNIFDSLRHAMMVSLGANGNVFGYNYSINNVQGNGETELNQGWIPPDISIHGHYPFMNLFEGNDVQEIGIGDYWGSGGKGNTYFRNKINGEGIFYYDNSHYQNIIGNITTKLIDTEDNSDFKLEHGNRINGNVVWDDIILDHNLPNSYYHKNKPDFFKNIKWPPFDPNFSNNNILPAQLRLEGSKVEADAGQDTTICLGDTIILKASGGNEYKWSTGENSSKITVSPTENKTYTVTVYDNGVYDSDEVNVFINPLPVVNITAKDEIICFNDSTVLTVTGGTKYLWSTGSTAQDITINVGGKYTVFVTDTNSCSNSNSILIEQAKEIIITIDSTRDISSNHLGFIAISTNNDGNYIFNWSNSNNFTALSEDLDSLTIEGCYTLTITDTLSNCSIDTTICLLNKTQTNNVELGKINICPNPTNGNFNIDFSKTKISNAKISLFDLTGKQILELEKQAIIENIEIKSNKINTGLYFIKIKSNRFGILLRKIIICK